MTSHYNLRSRNNASSSDDSDDYHGNRRHGSPSMSDSDSDKPQERRSQNRHKDSDLETDSNVSLQNDSSFGRLSSAATSPSITSSPQASRRHPSSYSSPGPDRLSSPGSRSFQSSPENINKFPLNIQLKCLPKKRGPSKTNQQDRDLSKYLPIVLITVFSAAVLIFITPQYFNSVDNDKASPVERTAFEQFVERVNELKVVFPSQDKRTWKTLKSSVKHILNDTDPQYPAVILFAVPKTESNLGTCFARQVAKKFENSSPMNEYIDCRHSSHLDPARAKLELDKKIDACFQTGRSVVIDHLQQLSPQSVLLLHGTCDNDNAPYKDVLIALVFHLDMPLNIDYKDVEHKVEEYLMSGLDVDKVGAMLSRIANNIVVIRHEQNGQTDKVCQ